jgi:hypothetical protein
MLSDGLPIRFPLILHHLIRHPSLHPAHLPETKPFKSPQIITQLSNGFIILDWFKKLVVGLVYRNVFIFI